MSNYEGSPRQRSSATIGPPNHVDNNSAARSILLFLPDELQLHIIQQLYAEQCFYDPNISSLACSHSWCRDNPQIPGLISGWALKRTNKHFHSFHELIAPSDFFKRKREGRQFQRLLVYSFMNQPTLIPWLKRETRPCYACERFRRKRDFWCFPSARGIMFQEGGDYDGEIVDRFVCCECLAARSALREPLEFRNRHFAVDGAAQVNIRQQVALRGVQNKKRRTVTHGLGLQSI